MSTILVPILFFLIRDYKLGLTVAIFFLILSTEYLMIITPGSFPDFSIHRIILIILIIVWFIKNKEGERIRDIPFIYIFLIFGISNLISVLASEDVITSIKNYISFTAEIMIFFIIIMTSLNGEKDLIKMLNFLWFALATVALFAVIEKYQGFNPVDAFVPGYVRLAKTARDVKSTFPHRILLGTAMTMGWPIALALTNYYKNKRTKQILLWISIFMLTSSVYFSNSRGPWLGTILAGLILFVLGSGNLRKKLMVVFILVICVLIAKPGVRQTLSGRTDATLNPESFKGGTYNYRWELWRKAYSEVSKSPIRMVFGYGPGTSETIDWGGPETVTDDWLKFWSWDNHYASEFLETGFLGIIILFTLYLSILGRLYLTWRKSKPPYNDLLAGILASVSILIFMKSNVKIFSSQLEFLFWSLLAIGILLKKITQFILIDTSNNKIIINN
jgi:hypothetical protein